MSWSNAIRGMAHNSPTKEDRASGKRWGHGTCWSEDEVQFVRDHWQDMTPTQISRSLSRPRMSVYHHISAIKRETEPQLSDLGAKILAHEKSRRVKAVTKSVKVRTPKPAPEPCEVPPVKPPGLYVEYLHSFVAEDFELRAIWAKWNGYSSVTIVKRDAKMDCTLLCTAELW